MSSDDRDFPFKLAGKRLAWSYGYLPLINVPVRLPSATAGKAGQDVTDADVLGFRVAPDGAIACFLADCRDTTSNAAERVLWVKGLASYFDANKVYLLKKRLPENARWMAAKLGIHAADARGVETMMQGLKLEELKGPYFDGTGYHALERLSRELPKDSQYKAVHTFLHSTIWSLSVSERVQSLLELLNTKELHKTFRPNERAHQGLVLYGSFKLALAVANAVSQIDPTSLGAFEERLREVLHGGADSLAQKRRLAKAFKSPVHTALDVPAFPLLLEVAHRIVIKRYALNDAVRYLDVLRHYHAAGRPAPESASHINSVLARKFARDLLTLFVRSNSLDPEFLSLAAPMSAERQDPDETSRAGPTTSEFAPSEEGASTQQSEPPAQGAVQQIDLPMHGQSE